MLDLELKKLTNFVYTDKLQIFPCKTYVYNFSVFFNFILCYLVFKVICSYVGPRALLQIILMAFVLYITPICH